MTDTAAITQKGIDVLTARAPEGAEISGEWHEETQTWIWTLVLSTPTEENPDARQGASRQYVPTEQDPTPSDEYLDLMVTEMLSTFQGATA